MLKRYFIMLQKHFKMLIIQLFLFFIAFLSS